MINGKAVLGLIPARGGSKGFPGKNIKELCGKPLVSWPIDTAKKSKYIDRVIVSTDSEKIAKVAESFGVEVPFKRPTEFATDTSSTFSVIEHLFHFLGAENETYDYLVLLEPTSPLTTFSDVDKALEMLVKNRGLADSIVSVSKIEATHPVFDVRINNKGLIEPYVGNGFNTFRRQEIDTLYYFEGSLYISDVSILIKEKSFYHNRTLPYIVPRWKAFEIDEPMDLICVEAIFKNLKLVEKDYTDD